MFNWKHAKSSAQPVFATQPVSIFSLEGLEDRRLLSAGHGMPHHGGVGGGFGCSGGLAGATIVFSQAPKAIQDGLDALATADNVTPPADTQTVYLGNANGVETYTVKISGTGTVTKLTVDQNGKPVTAPTQSSTAFGAVTDTDVTNEITAIATALNLTAPTSTTSVNVSTAADGTAIYTVKLVSSSTSNWRRQSSVVISVDSNGNPVGNQRLPLSTLSTAIQDGLKNNAPAGATALAPSYLVDIRTENGVTFYSATYKAKGIQTTVTVNSAGELTSLPSVTKVQFSALPDAAKAELQAMATAAGVATTISDTQTVLAYDEANGTTIYSVTLIATITTSTGKTVTRPVTLSVDQSGNPTVPPQGGLGGERFDGFAGEHGRGHGNGHSGGSDTGNSTASSSKSGKSKASTKANTTRRLKF